MNRDYLTYSPPRLTKPYKPKRNLLTQKEAGERYGIPAIEIKWAIEAGRIDFEFTPKYDRRYVVNNRRFRDWANNRRNTRENYLSKTHKTDSKLLTNV